MNSHAPYLPRTVCGAASVAFGLSCLALVELASAAPVRTTPAPGSDIAGFAPRTLQSFDAFVVQTPDGRRYDFQGTPDYTHAGGLALNVHSSDRHARLYAYSVGERLIGAELYSANGSYRIVTVGDQLYWEPMPNAASIGAPLAEPGTSRVVTRKAAPVAAQAAPDADGVYEITVLALYSPAVESDFGSEAAVVAEIDRRLTFANAIYAFNQVPVRLRPTSIERFDAALATDDFYLSRDQLATDPFVTARRNATQSDLVLLYRAPGSLCGLSSGFNGMQPTGVPDHIDPELDAFNVISLATEDNCGSLVTAHEIGHSLSAGHEYATSAVGVTLESGAPTLHAYWKPYAHALPCQGQNTTGYFSMMWGPGVGGADEPGGRTDVITNPRALLAEGRTCGSEGVPGIPASQADNVRAMSEAAPYVAAYRNAAASDSRPGAGAGGGALYLGAILMLAATRVLLNLRCPRRQVNSARLAQR